MNKHSSVLAISLGFLIFFFINENVRYLYFLFFLIIISLLIDQAASLIHNLWISIARILNLVIPKIILSSIFYLILTPLSFLSRVFKQKTEFISKNTSDTLFNDTSKSFQKDSFKDLW